MHKLALTLTIVVCWGIAPLLAWGDIYLDQESDGEIRLSNLPGHETCCVLVVEQDSNPPAQLPASAPAKAPLPYDREVHAAAVETALDPALLHAVIAAESHHNPQALSPRGARGLMQLMPDTARRFQVKDVYDPAQNVRAGARYLRELHDLFHGDISLALAAYNAGPGAVQREGGRMPPYAETRDYVPRVLRLYRAFSARMM